MSADAVLELRDIAKTYEKRAVLDRIALNVQPGECVMLTGENGCGKSTLLRIAAGLTRPTRGAAVVRAGVSVQYVPDQFPPIAMTGRQFLRAMAKVDCIWNGDMIRQFRMDAYLDEPISCYSKGMRGKIGVMQALLARPKLLLMDEPVSGQDADSRAAFIRTVWDSMDDGCAVLMASHETELARALATRVFRIESGRLKRIEAPNPTDAEICLCAQCDLFARGVCGGRGRSNA